ncbi:hypothetical protein NL676_032587 [Syzygium grande]|nr:hypothetical protein NL676_032587 [Syzygium grande]
MYRNLNSGVTREALESPATCDLDRAFQTNRRGRRRKGEKNRILTFPLEEEQQRDILSFLYLACPTASASPKAPVVATAQVYLKHVDSPKSPIGRSYWISSPLHLWSSIGCFRCSDQAQGLCTCADLLGNPSNIYYAHTISLNLSNFWASIRLPPLDELVITPHPVHGFVHFNSLVRVSYWKQAARVQSFTGRPFDRMRIVWFQTMPKPENSLGIAGDGRCLFRSVIHGAYLRAGKQSPSESLQKQLADELRAKVADEFVKRRADIERFLESDFDTYVAEMRQPHKWGGEPELLMCSHILQMPITVFMKERFSETLKIIAEYGREYGTENSINVLYHSYGHYDALLAPIGNVQSKMSNKR